MLEPVILFVVGIFAFLWGVSKNANLFLLIASILFVTSAVASFSVEKQPLVVNGTVEIVDVNQTNYPIAYASVGMFLLTMGLVIISIFEWIKG